MQSLTIYNYDKQGYFINQTILDESDRNPKNLKEFLLPANCTTIKPSKIKEQCRLKWSGKAWEEEKVAKPENKTGFELVWQENSWEYVKLPASLEEVKVEKYVLLREQFVKERDQVRWLDIDGKQYGFDCKQDAVLLFCTAYLAVQSNKEKTTLLKVFVKENQTDVVSFSFEQMQSIFSQVRNSQFAVYEQYKIAKMQINKARSKKSVEAISLAN